VHCIQDKAEVLRRSGLLRGGRVLVTEVVFFFSFNCSLAGLP
jgi:hypothetical protein